jgi:hypothetical protein
MRINYRICFSCCKKTVIAFLTDLLFKNEFVKNYQDTSL